MDPELFKAAHVGDVRTLKILMDQTPVIHNQVTPRKRTALHIAAKEGHSEFVRKILEIKPVGISGVLDFHGNTAMHEAAKEGHVEVVSLLIEHSRDDANKLNRHGESPLFIASDQGHLTVVRQLLGVTSSRIICHRRRDGQTCLHRAAYRGHLDVVRELFARRSTVVANVDMYGATPLHSAASAGHTDMVRELINLQPTLCYIVDNVGRSALHVAAMKGHVNMVHEIMCCSPDCIEIQNKDGKTALHLAAENDRREVINYFLQTQLPYMKLVNEQDKRGNTVLHLAADGRLQQMVELLASFPILNINAINKQGFTALDVARKETQVDCTTRIVDALERTGAKEGSEEVIYLSEEKQTSKSMKDQGFWNNGRVDTLIATLIITLTFQALVSGPDWIQNKTCGGGGRGGREQRLIGLFKLLDEIAFVAAFQVVIIWMAVEQLQISIPRGLVFYTKTVLGVSIYSTFLAFAAAVDLVTCVVYVRYKGIAMSIVLGVWWSIFVLNVSNNRNLKSMLLLALHTTLLLLPWIFYDLIGLIGLIVA